MGENLFQKLDRVCPYLSWFLCCVQLVMSSDRGYWWIRNNFQRFIHFFSSFRSQTAIKFNATLIEGFEKQRSRCVIWLNYKDDSFFGPFSSSIFLDRKKICSSTSTLFRFEVQWLDFMEFHFHKSNADMNIYI